MKNAAQGGFVLELFWLHNLGAPFSGVPPPHHTPSNFLASLASPRTSGAFGFCLAHFESGPLAPGAILVTSLSCFAGSVSSTPRQCGGRSTAYLGWG